MQESPAGFSSRRDVARHLAQAVEPVCTKLYGSRMVGSRLGWIFAPRAGCYVGLWAQVENWNRAFRLEGAGKRFAIRFEVGVGTPGPDMYAEASLVHGTTTLLEALDQESRDRLADESWRILRAVVPRTMIAEAIDELGLTYRVEEGDAFFPVLAESDVLTLVSVLEGALPRLLRE